MKLIKSTLLAMTMFGINQAGTAFADTYKIQEDHTWVSFSVSHAGWAKAHGKFAKVSGTIEFDKDDVTKSSVTATIDATSLDTNSEQRDRDMAGPDFLNTAEFSDITFSSKTIEKTGENTGLIHGKLTIAGVSKKVTLDTMWNAEFPLPWDQATIKTGFTASTKIDVTDFGMNKLVEFGIGPEIEIAIDVEAIKQ